MPIEDAHRWNDRYRRETRYSGFLEPRPFLVAQTAFLPQQGLALDAAAGLGGNASYLMARGMRVVAVDISMVALRTLKQRSPDVMTVLADLTRFQLPDDHFDVIINFYYLQQELWPQYIRSLRPGGILIFETLMRDMLEIRPDTDPRFLIEPGELREGFSSLEILVYQEGWTFTRPEHPRAVASLVARKPISV